MSVSAINRLDDIAPKILNRDGGNPIVLVCEHASNYIPESFSRLGLKEDGVSYTLKRHAIKNGFLNVMIEIRNDLIVTADQCEAMASKFSTWLTPALKNIDLPQAQGAAG